MGRNMRYDKFLLLSVFCCCVLSCCSQDMPCSVNDGEHCLRFASYEVSPDSRTSLSVPADGQTIMFRDYFSVSFDCRIIPDVEKFGYVCRIVIDDTESIDVCLRNPRGGRHYLCLINSNKEISVFFEDKGEDAIFDWNTISLEFRAEEGNLTVMSEGKSLCCGPLSSGRHSVSVHFGVNRKDGFVTTDCAPMELKNVGIAVSPGKMKYCWSFDGYLTGSLVTDDSGRIEASVVNPVWTIYSHYHWNRQFAFTSETEIYPVVDRSNGKVFFVSGNKVTEYDFRSGDNRTRESVSGVDALKITNNFIVSPDGKRIIYYDFDQDGVFSEYDIEKGEWSRPVGRRTFSRSLAHNSFFSPSDSSLVQIFGYGFHIYNNIAYILRKDGSMESVVLDSIPPRYLGAISLDSGGDRLFVLGGRGNRTGIQEYGINTYGDMWEVDLEDFSCSLVAGDIYTDSEVSVPSFYYDRSENIVFGLFFSPDRSNTCLHIRNIDLDTGESVVLGDDIPFFFIDTESYADIMADYDLGECYAVTAERDNDLFRASVYSISLPVLGGYTAEEDEGTGKSGLVMLVLSALAVLTIAFVLLKKRKPAAVQNVVPDDTNEDDTDEDEYGFSIKPADETAPGIYLINGFKVVDRSGNDITKNFTPIMRHLLALIILHTENNSGISNAELKDAFWMDKSEASYYNNRSVLFHKIRLQLGAVGDNISIKSGNGRWIYDDAGQNLCDYLRYHRFMSSFAQVEVTEEHISQLVRIAHYGELLTYVQFDGFDKFKAEYTDRMIDLLVKMRDDRQYSRNDALRTELCNCLLLFDALDEESLRIRCRILIRHKHIGKAHALFRNFVKEYQKYMGEEFEGTFNEFVRNEGN